MSFALHRGEILGFAGLIGAGRSEIARGVTRLEGNATGRGPAVRAKRSILRDYADCIAQGIVYLSEDRKGDGVFLDLPIAANIAALDLSRVARRRRRDRPRTRDGTGAAHRGQPAAQGRQHGAPCG